MWGTLFLDYESEEESRISLCPKICIEIIGVSEWDGEGRANKYQNGFLVVTHTGGTYYFSATSSHERDEWILHIRRSLECNFGNSEIIPFKPSKVVLSPSTQSKSVICHKSGLVMSSSAIQYCKSCGNSFSPEHLQASMPILQCGVEESMKVCLDCKLAQMCIIWLKSMNYVHAMILHEQTSVVASDANKYKVAKDIQYF